MSVASVGSSTTTASATTTAKSSALSLDADTFMKMFTTQIANQNPMDPMNSADFLNQFAQISSVQTMSELQKTLNTFSQSVGSLTATGQASEAASLLGRTISYSDADGNLQVGAVESVRIQSSGQPQLVVGGVAVNLDAVRQVFSPAA